MAKYGVFGGMGDMTGCAQYAGGFAENSVAYTDMQGANGAPIVSHGPTYGAVADTNGAGKTGAQPMISPGHPAPLRTARVIASASAVSTAPPAKARIPIT